MTIEGGCLCGAVRYRASEEFGGGHCHCTDCRKTSGTGHGSHMIVPEGGFALTGTVATYDRPADSGNMVSRNFCPACGSGLFSTNNGMPGMVFIRASSLDDPEVFKPQMIVYADRAASWDLTDPALPRLAKMPAPDEMPEPVREGQGA